MLSVTPNFGILTLDPTAASSFYHSGAGRIIVNGGDIAVDSSSTSGAKNTGSGNVSATHIFAHGNLSTSGSGKFLGSLVTASSLQADPLATVPQPTAPSTTFAGATINNQSATLSPGTYLGRIQIGGNSHVTLLPGLYYSDGGITITGGTVTGSGVTIFAAGGSSINISGSSSVTLSAPTSGADQGIVLFQSRSDVRPITIANSATATFTGVIYAADAQLQITSSGNTFVDGNGGTIPGALVVRDFNLSGAGSLTVNANAGGVSGNLSITKTDNLGGSSITSTEGLATAGSAIVYTITVCNAGPSAAFGATVTDAFPTSITSDTYTVATTGGAADLKHSSGSGAIADSVNLPAGGTITYTVTANISASATGLFMNTASVAGPAGFTDTNTANNTASDTDSLYKADLAIINTDGATTAVPGTQDTYTIVVTNNGPTAVTGATVKDLLAANTDIASDTFTVAATGGAADTTNAASGSGSINDSVTMPSGSTITYTVTANIDAGATGSLANSATVATPSNVADPVPANNSATDTDTLTPQVDLLVINSDNDSGSVVPGTQVTYTIAVKNTGPSNAVGVTIADALPADIASDTFTAVGTTGAAGFTSSGSGNIDDAAVNLASGACLTYTVTADVSASSTGSLANTATAKAGTGETNTNRFQTSGTTSTTDTDALTPNVDLVVTKTDNASGDVVSGEAITYTITVQNTGPSDAVGVAIADTLPAAITSDTYTSVGATGASGFTASGGGNISDASVNLAVGSSVTYTVVANVSAAATGSLVNIATATAGTGESNTNPNQLLGTTSATDTDALTPQVDLVVTKTDNDNGSVVPGDSVTYTVTVENTGPSYAVGVAVADTLPAGITSDTYTAVGTSGASGFAASGSGNISDSSVNLTAGSSITYTVVANVGAGNTGSLSNTATAAAGAGETNTNPNEVGGVSSAIDTDAQTPQVDLVVTATDDLSGNVVPGQPVTYTITVQNTGPSNAVGVAIADALPAAITSDTYTAVGTSGASGFTASGSGNLSDASVNLAVGSKIIYTIVANISASATGTLSDTATATAGAGETNTNPAESGGATSATDSGTLSPKFALVVVKSDSHGGSSLGGAEGSVVPGSTVTYTITVQSTGPSNAVGLTIADAFPASIASDTYTAAGTSGASGFTTSGSGNIDDTSVNLPSGGSITYTVVANISSSATGSISNAATATVGTGEINTYPTEIGGSTSAIDIDTLTPKADLVVTNTDNSGGQVVPGAPVTYTITVQNTGPSNAVGATVADTLPAPITSDTYTAVGTTGASGFTASGIGNIDDASVNLAAGSSITYTVTANVRATASGSLVNTAAATVGTGETNTNPAQSGGTTSATDTATITPQVDLVVTKIDSGFGTAVPGQQVVYVIAVTNAGPNNATGVTIADMMPAGIAGDTYSANGSAGASGFTASGSGNIADASVDLTAGSSVTYLVMANVSSAATGSLTNTATATVGTDENNTFPGEVAGTTTATDTDTLAPQVQLSVMGSDTGGGMAGGAIGSVVPGTTVTYTITVQNSGPSDAVAATIADALPAYITSDTYTAVGIAGASGFTASGSGNIDDAAVNLASGSSITYTVTATIDPGATATLNNRVTATVGAGETNTEFNQVAGTTTATDSDNITPQVDLVVTKTDDGGGSSVGAGTTGSVVPGGTVTYTITVENTGPSNAAGTAIADSLPAGITSDTYTAIGTSGASGFTASGSGNISDVSVNLASGSSITYTIVANVDPSATGTLSNSATATAASGETNTNPNQSGGTTTATDVDTLTPEVDLVVTKSDDGGGTSADGGTTGSVAAGGTVTYTITVQNSGASNAVGVAIADSLPVGITSDTFTAVGTSGTSGFTAGGSGNISDASVNLAAGSSITYTVVANIDSAANGTLSNTVTAAAGSGEINTNPNQSGGITSATDNDLLS